MRSYSKLHPPKNGKKKPSENAIKMREKKIEYVANFNVPKVF
jgi:hypothetical protein